MAKVETGTQARQGEKGRPILYVLIAAVLLAVVAGAVTLTWQGKVSPADHASQSGQAARQTVDNPSTPPEKTVPAEQKPN